MDISQEHEDIVVTEDKDENTNAEIVSEQEKEQLDFLHNICPKFKCYLLVLS